MVNQYHIGQLQRSSCARSRD